MIEGRPRQLVRLRARPDTLYVSQGRAVLATDLDGCIADGPDHGLFVHETRLLSRYRYFVDGRPLQPVALSNVDQHSWLGYYIALPPRRPRAGGDPGSARDPLDSRLRGNDVDADHEQDSGSGQVQQASQQTLELCVARYVGEGIHEDLDLTNFAFWPTRFRFEIEIDADFADPAETEERRVQHGQVRKTWKRQADDRWRLEIEYEAEHRYANQSEQGIARIRRGLIIEITNASTPPQYKDSHKDGRVGFDVSLMPHEQWHCCVNLIPVIEGHESAPAYQCRSFGGVHSDIDRKRQAFLDSATQFRTPDSMNLAPTVSSALQQAGRDLAALRLYDLDESDSAWTMAAGLPMYIALFGRDTLTAAWQAAMISPAMLRGTLPALAKLQGTTVNDWRDEQPGRMIHEAHTGPLAALNYNPRLRYYGSVTTSAFYPVAVSELWHWTGDKDLIRPLIDPALRALKWLDEQTDHNNDGFYEYLTRSEQGVTNQAWKDSGDAIVYEDGSQVEPPIATCEEQGFAYAAKLHLSEVLWWLGEKDLARKLYREAREFKKRFNDVFWMEDDGGGGGGYYAMGLDSHGRQIRTIGSNPGHCVATAIVDDEHAARTVDRMFADDLFSGWGVRTLSSRHPAYNPYSYHRGTIWPVEQGTFAMGFFRYGLHERVQQICKAQFEAAALFDFHRLPECFSGHPRDDDHPFPAIYPQANAPQAWSASAVFCMVQAMLGLYPYAPLNTLFVDPHLPDWLPELTVENLHVGGANISLHFRRVPSGRTVYRVLEKRGRLHVLRQPSPWSLTATLGERVADAMVSVLPGR